jgi:hypothetical protein
VKRSKRRPANSGALRVSRTVARPSDDTGPAVRQDGFPVLQESSVTTSDLSLHDLFERQTRSLLDSADLSEEERQSVLCAMACPCCGGAGMSFSLKLRSGK